MNNSEKQFDQYLLPFSDEISSLVRQLREYLRNETKPAFEIVGDTHHSLNIGFGFTEKVWDCYCTINTYSNHINISFPFGSTLTDPEGQKRTIRMQQKWPVKRPLSVLKRRLMPTEPLVTRIRIIDSMEGYLYLFFRIQAAFTCRGTQAAEPSGSLVLRRSHAGGQNAPGL